MNETNAQYLTKQKTLQQPITFMGIGLHTGKKVTMTLFPADDNCGINFIRKDVDAGTGFIPARWYNVIESSLSTVIANQHNVSLSTVEHLLAALYGCGVDNALIEIDGPEVPIMDGSAAPFVTTIESIGTRTLKAERKAIWIHRPVEVRTDDKYAILIPGNHNRITVEIDFPNPNIGSQTFTVDLINEAFRNDVARARTFGFANEIAYLRKRGLIRGGSLQNAILVDGERIVNDEGLRYRDEFVRHKILDCVGDLSLAGVHILGHFFSYKPGHELNNLLLKEVFNQHDAWSYTTIDDYHNMMGIDREMYNQKLSTDSAVVNDD